MTQADVMRAVPYPHGRDPNNCHMWLFIGRCEFMAWEWTQLHYHFTKEVTSNVVQFRG